VTQILQILICAATVIFKQDTDEPKRIYAKQVQNRFRVHLADPELADGLGNENSATKRGFALAEFSRRSEFDDS
jgi:hypothetical protein